MKGVAKAVAFTLLACCLPSFYLWLTSIGVAVHYYDNQPGNCSRVAGVSCGAEKIVKTADGLAFITSGFKDFAECNHTTLKGQIFLFDFNRPHAGVQNLKINSRTLKAAEFNPHGMDIVETGDDLVKLFVVNHGNASESVEVFTYRRKTESAAIEHDETIRDDKFYCLNDIAAVDGRSFYATNFVRHCHQTALYLAELLIAVKSSNIVFYRKKQTTQVVAENYASLNGVALSPDKRILFAASFSNRSLQVFDVNREGLVDLRAALDISYVADNVYIDNNGDLYVGVFKRPYHTVFFNSKTVASVIRIRKQKQKKQRQQPQQQMQQQQKQPVDGSSWQDAMITEVFHDSGAMIYSVSSAVHHNKQFLFGSVHNSLVYCDAR